MRPCHSFHTHKSPHPPSGRVGDVVAMLQIEFLGIGNHGVAEAAGFQRCKGVFLEILDMVDEKKIAFNPAVELSYLKPSEQKEFLEAMDYAQASPSLSQAQRLKKLSQEGGCTLDAMCEVMNEIKKDELDHVTIKNEVLRKYFPKSYTPKQMQDTIIRLLEKWQRSKQRDMER